MDMLEPKMREKKPTLRFQNHTDAAGLASLRHLKRFKCNVCNKRFSSKYCLTEHTYKHTNVKPITCVVCQTEFRHASQFTLHKKKHNISQIFTWPRLVEFDKGNHGVCEVLATESQKIELPLITGPQIQILPLFQEVLGKSFIGLLT